VKPNGLVSAALEAWDVPESFATPDPTGDGVLEAGGGPEAV
jgi:hypothetical protein